MPETRNERGLLLVHGAAVILVGLLLGLAAVAEELAGTQPTRWRAGHGALLLAGAWLLAVSAVFPQLRLTGRQRAVLCWSLLATAYAFTIAIIVQASTGVRMLSPAVSVAGWVGYVANLVTVAAGIFAALLTFLGALGAMRAEAP
jgi:hypothetical protein